MLLVANRFEAFCAIPWNCASVNAIGAAWYDANSSDQTHPVAQKLPVVASGHEFFDMRGNVAEYVGDSWLGSLPGGVDPFVYGGESGEYFVTRGTGYYGADVHNETGSRKGTYANSDGLGIGFRLVREIR